MTTPIHIVCPHCDAVNRLPPQRLADGGRCGQCHRALFDGQPLALSQASFERHASRSDIPLVVDFWAAWCGPCKMMAPAFEAAASRLEPRARLAKVNTEQEQGLAMRFGIRSIPTLALFVGGQERARQAGAMDTNGIVRWVETNL
ncbi:thioredoxin TrxC [Halochromatium roseum]|uniref:thioredoxin TrxC n=1 Tax=Halochromatium roseum TaxID=391920 RepID=UPI001913A0D0|nr:thioredoxin TrxC [Halochromatium roseum]MBK5939843.1 thiol reductase thioredoxin [Halochromatium roseum]